MEEEVVQVITPTVIKPLGQALTVQDAKSILNGVPASFKSTELFIKGDHWQNRAGWVGYLPDENKADAVKQVLKIQSAFTFKNVLGGIVKRLIGAVAGKEPDTAVITGEGDSEQKDADMVKWWEDKKAHEVIKDFVAQKSAYGKASIRIHIPQGYLKIVGNKAEVDAKTWQEALKYIYVECPHYSKVNNKKDVNYGTDVTVMSIGNDKVFNADIYEIYYLTKQGKTIVRQIRESTDATKKSEDLFFEIDLGGNPLALTVGEFDEAVITNSTKSQQRALNHAKTMEHFALENINFPETVFLNAEMEKETVTDTKTGKKVNRLKEIVRGAGNWISLIGTALFKVDGSEGMIPADVKWRQPADPEKFAGVAVNNSRDIHEETGMLYVFLADNPYPSGESRIESMTDYLILLIDNKTLCDKVGLWLLQTVYRLAHRLANEDVAEDVKFIFSTKLTLGRISVADKTLMLEEVAQKLRSRRNYQIASEITDDPTLEDKAILEEMEITAKLLPPEPVIKPKTSGAGA